MILTAALFVGVMSTYIMWHGANAVGHRHFITALPLLVAITFAAHGTLTRSSRWLLHLGIVIGMIFNLCYLLFEFAGITNMTWDENADSHASFYELASHFAGRVASNAAGLQFFLLPPQMLPFKLAGLATLFASIGTLIERPRPKA